ncbi:MAG TPA: hypothetical protein VGA63_08860 [Geopsychrobacteraceae bacterium]|jgi:hypothetical protein
MRKFQFIFIVPLLLSFSLVGCGSGGSGGAADAGPQGTQQAYYALATDTYGIKNPTWIEASADAIGLVLRAEEISSSQEMWFDTTIFRIDCPEGVSPGSYDLGEPASACALTIFNGQSSSNIRTIAGSLTVTEAGQWFSGSIEAVIADYDVSEEQLHWFSAAFSAPVGHGEALAISP